MPEIFETESPIKEVYEAESPIRTEVIMPGLTLSVLFTSPLKQQFEGVSNIELEEE